MKYSVIIKLILQYINITSLFTANISSGGETKTEFGSGYHRS